MLVGDSSRHEVIQNVAHSVMRSTAQCLRNGVSWQTRSLRQTVLDSNQPRQEYFRKVEDNASDHIFLPANDEVSDGWPCHGFRIAKTIPGQPFAPPKS